MAHQCFLPTFAKGGANMCLSVDESYVSRRFRQKLRKTFGRVSFLEQAITAFYVAVGPPTPTDAKARLTASVASIEAWFS
jgi:hypothetical protein